ncbi:hypothetical protein [Kineosporia succinea]
MADPGRWERGATGDIDGEQLQLWSYGGMLAICRTDAAGTGSVQVVSKDDPTTTTEPELAATRDLGATREISTTSGPTPAASPATRWPSPGPACPPVRPSSRSPVPGRAC